MRISEKIYRLLMRAYPRDYRSRYAEPMQQLFRDSLRDSRGLTKLITLWARTLADWVVSVPASYRTARHTPFRSFGEPARRCVFFARFAAGSFSSGEITLNHLLLGILRQQPSLVSPAALTPILRAIEADEPHGRSIPARTGKIVFAKAAVRVITAATAMVHAAGRENVTPADLAAAIQQESNSLAARLLREHIPNRD